MKGLNKSEKILIAVLLVMLVGYVYYQYVITPASTKLQIAQSNVDNYEQELLQSKLMAASNKKMTDDMNALKVIYDKDVKLMPKSDMSAEIIRDVNTLALNNKVTLNSLTLGDGAEYKSPADAANTAAANNNTAVGAAKKADTKASTSRVMAVPVTINISGDYNSFLSFINNLETSNRITNINSVNVAKQGTDPAAGSLSINLNVSMLYVQDGTAVENKYDFNNGIYSKDNPFN